MSESEIGNKQKEKNGLVFNEDGSLNMEASAEVLKTTIECERNLEKQIVSANLPQKQGRDINDLIDEDVREALVSDNPADHGI
jgi:hypothetical protein